MFNSSKLIKYLTDDDFLSNINGIWSETIQSSKHFWSHDSNISALANLEKHWVKLDNFSQKVSHDWRLKYIKFAITGKFEISRDQIIQKLVLEWADFAENMTSNTNLIIIWQDPSSKVSKADKLWIKKIFWLDGIQQELWIDFGIKWLFW